MRGAKRGGPAATVNVREVLNAIFSVLSHWPPVAGTAQGPSTQEQGVGYFFRWEWERTPELLHALYVAVRERSAREASPTTAIIDCQTSKGAQKGASRASSAPSA
jgi:hypothetical protein